MVKLKPVATATVRSTGADYRQDIDAGEGHRVVADEPASRGGGNAGAAPFDLLLSALGACTAITLQLYAKRKGWDLGEVGVQLELYRNRDGDTRIERALRASGRLDDAQWQRLLEIAEKTPVTMVVKHGAAIDTRRTG
jgi:putative redox protein